MKTAVTSLCAKCGQSIGDSSLFIGGKLYHHECSPYAVKRVQAEALDRKALQAAVDAADEASPFGACYSPGIEAAILAYLAALPEAPAVPVGEAGTMPGTDGFTMACFKAVDVPIGTKLYATPPAPTAAVDGEVVKALRESIRQLDVIIEDGIQTDFRAWRDDLRAALKAHLSPGTADIPEEMVDAALADYAKSAGIEGTYVVHQDWLRPAIRAALEAATPSPNDGEAKP